MLEQQVDMSFFCHPAGSLYRNAWLFFSEVGKSLKRGKRRLPLSWSTPSWFTVGDGKRIAVYNL